MDGSGIPLKPSSHEQHAKLSAKLFELALPPLRRHFACEAEAEQSSKFFALSLACFSWLLVFSKAATKNRRRRSQERQTRKEEALR